MHTNKEGYWFDDYNKPDLCPKCKCNNVDRVSTPPGNMEYEFGDQYYICNDCGYTEDAPIVWCGGDNLPESDWWVITKYPISYYEDLIKKCDIGIEMNTKDILRLIETKNKHVEMIKKLKGE